MIREAKETIIFLNFFKGVTKYSIILSFIDVESSKIGAWLFHPEKVKNKVNKK